MSHDTDDEARKAEAAAREARIQAAAEKIAAEDEHARAAEEQKTAGSAPEDADDIAAKAAQAGLEQAHRSAFTHP